ncbi:MAG: HPF/RaiA family ribosome-associated protein [Nitrospirae bacterium]|nr:HPF/RaiA family ribosome-associated protein [Nitrospirota bacterium]
MQVPLKIVFRDVSPYEDVLDEEIRKWADKLDQHFDGIISCRVVVEKPHKHHKEGNLYKAAVTLTVPNKQIVVSREHPLHHSHEDIFVAVHHVFEDAARQLEEYALMRYRDVKDHDLLPHGVVSKLFPKEGYGFIQGFGGREIYFHHNSVLDGFERLKIGMEVRFEEEAGEKGPQASTVKIIRKAHTHHRRH